FTDANHGTAIGNFGAILRTEDGGANWTHQPSGTNEHLLGVFFMDANNGIVVGRYGTILRTTDGGVTWTPEFSDTHSDLFGVFFKELEGSRKAEFARSEERIGIPKESWYLQQTPMADLLIGYMESPDFTRALDLFARSQDEFDIWFKRRLAELTGADLNSPPP